MQVEKHQPKSIVHPWLEICDIAGLVKGAAQVMFVRACVMYLRAGIRTCSHTYTDACTRARLSQMS